jgi:ElaB/YqjD/DUF883 family membrane-anchored ribosome-binding protein
MLKLKETYVDPTISSLQTRFPEASNKVGEVSTKVQEVVGQVGDKVGESLGGVKDKVGEGLEGVNKRLAELGKNTTEGVAGAVGAVQEKAEGVRVQVAETGAGIAKSVGDSYAMVGERVGEVGKNVGEKVGEVGKSVGDGYEAAKGRVVEVGGAAAEVISRRTSEGVVMLDENTKGAREKVAAAGKVVVDKVGPVITPHLEKAAETTKRVRDSAAAIAGEQASEDERGGPTKRASEAGERSEHKRRRCH